MDCNGDAHKRCQLHARIRLHRLLVPERYVVVVEKRKGERGKGEERTGSGDRAGIREKMMEWREGRG